MNTSLQHRNRLPRITNEVARCGLFSLVASVADLTVYCHNSLNALLLGLMTSKIESPWQSRVASSYMTRGCDRHVQKLRFTRGKSQFLESGVWPTPARSPQDS